MFPNVMSVFSGWTSPVQMKIVNKKAIDFEAEEQVLLVVGFEAVMQPMPPQKVDRKPENLRVWKWWEMWSTTKVQADTDLQDQNGVVFRIQSVQDWSQAGYFKYELTEKPV
jgi:hypothetical protein